MFRVVQVITSPDGGGAEGLVRELTRRLPQHGIDCRAIYFRNPRGVDLTWRETTLGVQSAGSPWACPRLEQGVRNLTGDGAHVVLHSHLTWPLYYASLVGNARRVVRVYTEHNTHNRRRDMAWSRPVERWVYRHYRRVVCVSEGTRIALRDWLDDTELSTRMTTIVNGARMLPMVERRRDEGEAFRLVSIGSLSRQKGFDVALRAVARLGEKIAGYTILGEGPERGRLEGLVRELGLEEKVRMPGYCDDVTPYLHEADLGVVPSRWEGFGLVAVEALSTGLPLAASDVPGLREVVTPCDATIVVEPGNEEALRNAIAYGLEHLARHELIGRSARLRAEEFAMDTMVSRYAELYREVVNE